MKPGILVGALVVASAVGLAGCGRARSPEAAQAKLCQAVAAGDPAALFEALDQQSRWDWMTVQKSHREAYDIILSNYPQGIDRERQLHRFERGATLGSGRALFVEEIGRTAVADPKLREACGPGARLERGPDDHHAALVTPSGARVALLLGPRSTWGYAALAEDAEDRRRRALAEADQVRANAADYERAATRNAR